jgi:hypothetical protein
MMKRLFLILACALYLPLFAQQDDAEDIRNERIESLKIGFITEKLALTTKEAEVFWPVFNKYEAEIRAVRKKQRALTKSFQQKTNANEQESDQYLTEQLLLKQQEIDVLKKYIPLFKKVIPTAKVAKLLGLEQEFKLKLLQQLKERKK